MFITLLMYFLIGTVSLISALVSHIVFNNDFGLGISVLSTICFYSAFWILFIEWLCKDDPDEPPPAKEEIHYKEEVKLRLVA